MLLFFRTQTAKEPVATWQEHVVQEHSSKKQIPPPEQSCLWEKGYLQKAGQISATSTIENIRNIKHVTHVSTLLETQLLQDIQSFQAGNITKHYALWRNLTNDNFILNIVQDGLKIDFYDKPQEHRAHASHFGHSECTAIDNEIQALLLKHVIITLWRCL